MSGGSAHRFGQTDLYNCTLILSQAVSFAFFPHSHVHGPARDLNVCVAETMLAVPCCHLMFMTYTFRHCGLLILKILSIQAHRNVERERMCVCMCLAFVLHKLIILSKFVTEKEKKKKRKEKNNYTYTTAK